MSKINRVTREHVKNYLYNYKWLKEEIDKRREEIISPYQETDTNIGGGQSNLMTSPTELTSIRLADDIRLAQLQRMKWAIDSVYTDVDATGKRFMNLTYFQKPNTLTLQGVAIEIGVSERTAKRLNTKIIISIAERIGWH